MASEVLQVAKLAGFSLTSSDAARAADFYQATFDCKFVSQDYVFGPDFEKAMGVSSGAKRICLTLGRENIELLEFDTPGALYPALATSLASDLIFQHLAIVVADMERAFKRLCAASGWTPISVEGPQRLPAGAGNVSAYKFRDPEGHPLELLAFPEKSHSKWSAVSPNDIFLGIDHSAISISNLEASVAFYEALGMNVSARSINTGEAQQRLDALPDVQVDVIALTPSLPTPHLELLHYGSAKHINRAALRSNDIASTRLVFDDATAPALERETTFSVAHDPDGHAVMLRASARSR